MMRIHHVLAAAVLAVLVLGDGALASAQNLETPRQRQGYYVGLGAHSTFNHYREDGDGLGTQVGGGGSFRLGQLLTRRLGLGLVFDVVNAGGDNQSITIIDIGVQGQVELMPNLALHGGVGMGIVILSSPDDEDGELRGLYGAAYTIGLSYDWFPGSRRTGGWAITPGVQLRWVPDEIDDSVSMMLGVELTYWSGLPRGQLDLPNDEAYVKR